MNRKDTIALLIKIVIGLLVIMVFIRLEPVYQIMPVIVLLLVALVLVVIETSQRQKKDYKKYQKKRSSGKS